MYTLPDNFNYELLSGCYLEMISFGASITKLDFARPQLSPGEPTYRVAFGIEGPLRYRIHNKIGSREFSDASSCSPLIELLLHDVTEVAKTGAASLAIKFGDIGMVEVDGEFDSEFESYSIYLASGEVVVV
ncbi:hypothetical protein ACFFTM_23715 [Pseudoduganella plicata]|uniref:Uncharacterized protein n=1 Tax=Pseudoduganella plicata TaxID=321984 RepID=A0AA87YBT8_9BURK|nr:hypothetical protein [Pseudoduganella plicata]GGZ11092.1 hypothetical protein GCM10007388_50670 [Pseudoduganella plicata]